MGQSAVKNPRKIFSQAGSDSALNNRVTNLENNEYKILYFQTISSTTGTITKPTGATILLDQFYSGGDALVETLSNGQPTGQSPLTIGGTVVSVTSFDISGNYVLSSTPSAYPIALVYIFKIKAIDLPNLNMINIMQMDSNGYVPYVGAITDLDLGEYELKAGQIELDQSPTGTAGVAVTRWNNTLGSTETTLKGGSVVLKNGVDLVARVVNKVTPNTTLTKAAYQVVKVSGASGQRLAVDFAQGDVDLNSADTLGVVTETIATNQEGFILTVGQLEEINTTGSLQGETWADGNVLYLSPTIPGAMTNVKPTGLTGHIVVLGYVEYAHAIHGKIYVKIMNGWELDELHNVYINPTTLANNDVLTYESSSQLWKNKQSNFLPILSKDITDSTALTGTTAITLMKSVLIPANTFTTGDIVKILNRAVRNTATGISTDYIYINTTNSLTGATLVGTFFGAFSLYGMERTLYIKSSTITETCNTTASAAGSEVTTGVNGVSNLNINWATNLYIIAAFQNVAVGNSTVMSSLIIQKI
jgi:nitrogen fixation protein